MRKIIIFMMLVMPSVVWGESKNKDSDWYVINLATQCGADDLSGHVKTLKEQGEKFTESETVKEGGKIISVKITEYWDNGMVITSRYYRGLKRCKTALNNLYRKAEAEENKYK